MTLPSSGLIKLSQLIAEFGGGGGNIRTPISPGAGGGGRTTMRGSAPSWWLGPLPRLALRCSVSMRGASRHGTFTSRC